MGFRVRAVVLVLAWSMLLAWPVAAQEQTGSIEGVVKDTSGGVLPGVTVEARLQGAGVSTAVTDANGVYRFPALPPGTYIVTGTLQGFDAAKSEAILRVGMLLKIDLTLAVAGVAETIQVTGESPLIDTKQNATFATVSQDMIGRIPKGRNFTDVIAMAPGANAEDRAGGISVSGASGSENRFIVDGVDTTNLRTGSSGKTVVYDFIQEVQVKTSGYNAEYPGAIGGVVNAVTKSGSNLFSGSAGFYYTDNDALRGDVRPSLRRNPDKTTEAQYTKTEPAVIPTWQPVFEVGGPIIKDRIFFYVGYAPDRTSTSRTVTFKTPPADGSAATQTFKQNNPNDALYGSVSAQLTNDLRVKFSYAPTWSRSRGAYPSPQPYEVASSLDGPWTPSDSRSTDDANIDRASTGSNSWNNSYSGLVDWLLTPSWFVNVAGGYWMTDTESLGNGTAIVHNMNENITDFLGDPALTPDLIQPSGYSDNKSSSKTVHDQYTRIYLNATSTWYLKAKGQHSIKAGMRFERFGNLRQTGQIEPTNYFYWNTAYPLTSRPGELQGKYGYVMVTNNVLGTGNIHSNNWGFFIQDGWSPISNLTINAGLRLESERVPFYATGDPGGIEFGFGDKIAPRIGFAYDVKGDSKWKLYGSFGRFFDIMKLEMPRGSTGGEQWHEYFYPLNTLDWKNVNCHEGDPVCGGGALGETLTLRFGSNDVNNPETIDVTAKYFGAPRNMIQDGIKPMSMDEFTFGLDHELSNATSMGVRYVHNSVGKAIEDFGWNEGGTEFYFLGNPGYGDIGTLSFLWDLPGNPCVATNSCLYHTANANGFHPQVKPVRKYDALELSFTKRLSNRWAAQAVYTYSRLWGNYPGLASSDEAGGGTARQSPNVNRLYDGPWMMYDTQGNEVLGRLNNDRPHYLKFQGSYDFKWGTTVGVSWYGRSGALFSKFISYQGYQWVFYAGRGTMGRAPFEQMTSLHVGQDIHLAKRFRLNLHLNVSNLFDSDTTLSWYDQQWRDAFNLASAPMNKSLEAFFVPWDPNTVAAEMQAAKKTMRPEPQYGWARTFLGRREIRLGAKFTF